MNSRPAIQCAVSLATLALLCPLLAADQITIEVPAEVKATLTREAAGNPILDLSRGECDGRQVFNATLKIDGSEYEATIDSKGHLERLNIRNTAAEEPEPTLDTLPAAVKAGLVKFAGTAKIDRVEKEDRKLSYTAVVTETGGKYRITVDESGKLLSKDKTDE